MIVLLGLMVGGCKTKPPGQLNEVQHFDANSEVPIIRLTKGGCFGTCPVYTLDIYPDGRAVFTPKKFTRSEEVQSASWPIKPLIDAFDEAEFMGLDTLYYEPIADLPTYTLSYRAHKITWNAGAPDNLRYLVTKLDQYCEDEGWIEPAGVREVTFKSNEIILHLREPLGREQLLASYSFCQLTWIKSLDTEENYGLLEFDTEAINLVDLLDQLSKDSQVKAVSRNHLLRPRGQ